MSENSFKRCKLHKDNAVQISWVQTSEAQVGNRMMLDDPKTGEPGWKVNFVYGSEEGQLPPNASRAFKQR